VAQIAAIDPATRDSTAQTLVLQIDVERCTGCRACEAACKLENRLGEGMFRNRVFWMPPEDSNGRFEFVVAVCQQCVRPACLRACGAAAISKDPVTGVVEIDSDHCTGCQECVLACPYGAVSFDYRRHKAEKCNLCADRRATGRGGPACAAACPGRAIAFGPRSALIERAHDDGRHVRNVDRFGLGASTVYLERTPPSAVRATGERDDATG
jgi:Fe-S-cluster-containing dehydrogenase component